jgi:hypothetical protein
VRPHDVQTMQVEIEFRYDSGELSYVSLLYHKPNSISIIKHSLPYFNLRSTIFFASVSPPAFNRQMWTYEETGLPRESVPSIDQPLKRQTCILILRLQ